MAQNITVQVQNNGIQTLPQANTVGDVRSTLKLGHSLEATVNGFSRSDTFQLRDGNFVSFTKKVSHG